MKSLTPEQQKLLEEFEEMLNQYDEEDLGFYGLTATKEWDFFDYDEEPPPLPVYEETEFKEETNKCKHLKTKIVFYTQAKACVICEDCKEDLGDYEE
jgi:hypothetical protein